MATIQVTLTPISMAGFPGKTKLNSYAKEWKLLKCVVFQGTFYSSFNILPFKSTNYVSLEHSKAFQLHSSSNGVSYRVSKPFPQVFRDSWKFITQNTVY